MKYASQAIIILVILADIISRQLGYQVFQYSRAIELLLMAVLCIILSRRINQAIAVFASGIFLGLLIDLIWFDKEHFQLNDVVSITVSIGIAGIFAMLKRAKGLTPDALLLIAACMVRYITINLVDGKGYLRDVDLFGRWRTYMEMGSAFTFLLLAIYIARQTINQHLDYAAMIVAFTYVDFQDNLSGNPDTFGWHEIAIVGIIYIVVRMLKKTWDKLSLV